MSRSSSEVLGAKAVGPTGEIPLRFLLCMLLRLALWVKFPADDNFKHFSYFTHETRIHISCKSSLIETICMKCQFLFFGKNKKTIINLSSAALAQSKGNKINKFMPKILPKYEFEVCIK